MKTKNQLLKELQELKSSVNRVNDEIENFDRLEFKTNKPILKLLKELDTLPLKSTRTIKLEITFIKDFQSIEDLGDEIYELSCSVKNIDGLSKSEVNNVSSFINVYIDDMCILNGLGKDIEKKYLVIKNKISKIANTDICELLYIMRK